MKFIGDDEDDEKQRFKLELEGKNELIILGLNPSNARGISSSYPDIIDDPTLNRVITFSLLNWNVTAPIFDGFLMLNVCAQSNSSPEKLFENDALHELNRKKIEEYLSGKNNISVLLTYGDYVEKKGFLKKYLKEIIQIFNTHGATLYHLGELTKNENPRHISPKNPKDRFNIPITSPLIKHDNFKI